MGDYHITAITATATATTAAAAANGFIAGGGGTKRAGEFWCGVEAIRFLK